jgi:adenylate cyclase
MPQLRQLAAIMFTDIVGYTAMMQKNEQQAVSMLKRNKAILGKIVADHEGDVVEYFGDGSLCIFFSVTEALQCALELQQELQKEEHTVPLRIGLHIGEILFEDGKVIGDGINLASRIQAIGHAGNILFSREIFNKIRNHGEFKTIALGLFQLKNVDEPMEVFALVNDGLPVPQPELMEGRIVQQAPKQKSLLQSSAVVVTAVFLLIIIGAFIVYGLMGARSRYAGKEKSIAILPFKNISNDTMQEYFSDGITEDIITQISKIRGLRVISGTSVMQYKNVSRNIKQIADELQVATILEGSVRREGNQVRITAQLIDANTDRHIWANNYDRNISEVFAIQSEVAQQIANELNVSLTADEGMRIQKKATVNVAAYEDYLLARQSRWDDAEKLLLRAIQKDSSFALAWSSLALIYSKRADNADDKPYYIRKSLDAALTAVNLGPELSETHMIFGDILKRITLNPRLSIKELEKSVQLNPNNAEAYVYMGFALLESGRFAEAEETLVKARQLDPKSSLMKVAWAKFYISSRNTARVDEYLNQLYPDTIGARLAKGYKAISYFLKDQYDSVLIFADPRYQSALTGIAYMKTGKPEKAFAIADSLKKDSENKNAFEIGILYAWLGENQKAMEYLNLAYRLYDYSLITIKVDKTFDPLRNDGEFKKLLVRMGME